MLKIFYILYNMDTISTLTETPMPEFTQQAEVMQLPIPEPTPTPTPTPTPAPTPAPTLAPKSDVALSVIMVGVLVVSIVVGIANNPNQRS